MVKWALLVEDSQGTILAVGQFRDTETARAWEDRHPNLGGRVLGTVPLVPTGHPWVGM